MLYLYGLRNRIGQLLNLLLLVNLVSCIRVTPQPNQPPSVNAGPDQTITLPGTADLNGLVSDDGLPEGSALTVSWIPGSGPDSVVFDNPNMTITRATFSVAGTYVLHLSASDSQLIGSDDVTITVNEAISLPPDPATVASPVDRSVATTLGEATEFLYTGANPIQTGVSPGTIEPKRVAVLRGQVNNRNDAPLPGVIITVLDHIEYGQTLSRADGIYDLAVNGGGLLTLQYEKNGYLPVQRQVQAPWQDYAWLPNVVMIPLDGKVTTIDLGSPAPIQVARGNIISDTNGIRQPTLLFPRGVSATMMLPGGITQSLSILQVRATEYTVGSSGPEAMPAELPPNSGYTHAIEFTVDEAVANGVKVNGKDVLFSQPVFYYVENFLNFPVGAAVPMGYYDNDRAVWVPSDNGQVIKVLNIIGGLAELDIDGSNIAASAAALAELGVTDAERQQLASLYDIGTNLWRVPLMHFSTWDCNWPFGPPDDAEEPNQPEPEHDVPENEQDCQNGSIIGCQNQMLSEIVEIIGTPFRLHYQSDRVLGRSSGRTLEVSLSGETVPGSLRAIILEILVAGRRFQHNFIAAANQKYTFTWDGQDAYGRILQGDQEVTIRLGYVYGGVYLPAERSSRSFGRFSGSGGSATIVGDTARLELTFWQEWQDLLHLWDARPQGLGGWTLNTHHAYDPISRVLYRGDGGQRRAKNLNEVIDTVVGIGVSGYHGDGGPATQARLHAPVAMAVGADGSFYISDHNNQVIRRVGPDGTITTVAGTGVSGNSGDGGPAAQARLANPRGLDIGPDGSLYIADSNNGRIRRVGPDGIITTVSGGGNPADGMGDGGLATQAKLDLPYDVAVGPDGNLYIADFQHFRVRQVGPDGIITTVAGTGVSGNSGDGGPAAQARFRGPVGVTVGPDGTLYIADRRSNRIRRVGLDGVITTVAGGNQFGVLGDGGPATEAFLNSPYDIVFGPDGSLYIADYGNNRIRRVGPDSIITTIAGTGVFGYNGDGNPAPHAQLAFPHDVALTPEGNLFIVDENNHRVRQVAPPLPGIGTGNTLIPAEDGSEIYIFDATGRHLRTVHTLTGATTQTFTYTAGLLVSVTDGDNNVTIIERDATGAPTAIVGPYGQRTTLGLDANGYLARVTNPVTETNQMTYTAEGLLTHFIDPQGNTAEMHYDAMGRLFRDENAADGLWVLNRVEQTSSYSVTLTSALSRTTTYQVENLPVGSKRNVKTFPSGLQTETLHRTDGSRQITFPDGMMANLMEGPDPRWGMQAPLVSFLTIGTPGGLVSSYTITRAVDLMEPTNPLSLVTMTDTLTINGHSYTSTYVAASQTFTATTPAGRQSTAVVDALGRVTRVQVANLNPTRFSYDARGRLASITQGDGDEARILTLGYNTNGYLATVTDPLTHTINFTNDVAGRVTQQTLSDSRVISYTYDANSNLSSITPAGQPAHNFTYTAANLLETYTPPDVGVGMDQTHYIYNLDRQLDAIIRPDGQMVDPEYDNAGRLSSLTIPRGTVTYTYDPTTGNLTTITAPGEISLTYEYDGDLLTGVTWRGPVTGSVSFTYTNDLRLSISQVNDANPIIFYYDFDRLLRQAGDLTLSHNPQNGLLMGSTLGNITDTWGYNGFGEPISYTAVYAGENYFTRHYNHDKLGRISSITETIAGVTQIYSYTYDLVGQLTNAWQNGSLIANYGYDSNGNRLSYTGPGGIITGTYDAQDRLLLYGTTYYTYTANGELLSKTSADQTTMYSYDVLGNLTDVILSDGTVIEYLIDGENRRVGKKVNGVLAQSFLYEDQLWPIAELDRNNNIVSRFIYASRENVPDYMIKAGVTYRIIADQLGSPRLIVNATTGQVAQHIDYDTWGNIIQDTNPGFQPFGFAGGIYDLHTRLVRFGARDYDAESGRWTVKDPIGFGRGDTNLYGYVVNDPVNIVDPQGADWRDWDLRWAADLSTGFANVITLDTAGSASNALGSLLGLGGHDIVNRCSGWYSAGEWAGYAWFAIVTPGSTWENAPKWLSRRNTWIKNKIFRWGWERFKVRGEWVNAGKPTLHFHLGPGGALLNHHLPHTFRTWYHHAFSKVRRYFR
jgi:RHS repeat-associated protein